jgi:hypothetical protein
VDEEGELAFLALLLAPVLIPAIVNMAPALPAFFDQPDIALRSLPFVGDRIDAADALSGRDTFTGQELSGFDRVLSGIGAGIPGGIASGGQLRAVKELIKPGDLVYGLRVTTHAAEGFVERSIQPSQVFNALEKGVKYLDTRDNTILHVIGERGKDGYTIVTDISKRVLVSVENFVRKLDTDRFKKLDE